MAGLSGIGASGIGADIKRGTDYQITVSTAPFIFSNSVSTIFSASTSRYKIDVGESLSPSYIKKAGFDFSSVVNLLKNNPTILYSDEVSIERTIKKISEIDT